MPPNNTLTWLLYPLLGPPLGALTVLIVLAVFPLFVADPDASAVIGLLPALPVLVLVSYPVGGIQALFVGTCVGVAYGFNNRPIPVWFPMLAALVSSLYVVGPALLRLGEPGGSVAMAGFWAVVHVLPALGVWLVHDSVRAYRLRARPAA